MACVLAEAGHNVVGCDIQSRLIQLERDGVHQWELGLPELWEQVKGNISLSAFPTPGCKLVFVCVQTPVSDDGSFDLSFIKSAISDNADSLVLCSTVAPGDCQKLGIRVYNPQWIALGNALHGLRNPPMVLLGHSFTAHSLPIGDLVAKTFELWRTITKSPVMPVTLEEAEIIKLGLNAYLGLHVSFGEVLGELCAKIGTDIGTVLKGLNLDPRVSTSYMWPTGLGYGGPCFPKDIRAFIQAAGNPFWLKAMEQYNQSLPSRFAARFTPDDKVYITNTNYKEGVPVQDESPYVALAAALPVRAMDIEEATHVVVTGKEVPKVSPSTQVIRLWDGVD